MPESDSVLRQALIAEYVTHREAFNRAPNMWDMPSEREEAGYFLQYPAPLHILQGCAPAGELAGDSGFWPNVRRLVCEALEGGASC